MSKINFFNYLNQEKNILNLNGEQVHDEDIPGLLSFLNANYKIKTVNLRWNFITDKGVELLAKNTTVSSFDLSYNNVTRVRDAPGINAIINYNFTAQFIMDGIIGATSIRAFNARKIQPPLDVETITPSQIEAINQLLRNAFHNQQAYIEVHKAGDECHDIIIYHGIKGPVNNEYIEWIRSGILGDISTLSTSNDLEKNIAGAIKVETIAQLEQPEQYIFKISSLPVEFFYGDHQYSLRNCINRFIESQKKQN